jgi:recombination protein RecT
MMNQELVRFSNAQQFGTFFEQHRGEFLSVAPPEFDVNKLRQIVFMNVTRNPELRKCSADSWLVALMQAAETGLIPGGVTQEAYLIPYAQEVQFQISYKGLIQLMKRYGGVRDVKAVCVYEGDKFEVTEGLHPDLKHAPRYTTRESASITHVYAVALLSDGTRKFEVLTREDVERRRKRSRAQKNSPWETDYAAMCMKSAVRALARTIDLSPRVSLFLRRDEDTETVSHPAVWTEAETAPVESPVSATPPRRAPAAAAMPVNESGKLCPSCNAPNGSRHARTCQAQVQMQQEATEAPSADATLLDVPPATDLSAIQR